MSVSLFPPGRLCKRSVILVFEEIRLQPRQGRKAIARRAKKCPACDAHHVDVDLHSYTVDKRPAIKQVAKLDKTVRRET